jgi:hypothetical protein
MAYAALALVVVGFLVANTAAAYPGTIGILAFEAIEWAGFAICIAGFALGVCNWRTGTGKLAACFGGVVIAVFLAWLVAGFICPSPAPN